jgi:hypothetical protein
MNYIIQHLTVWAQTLIQATHDSGDARVGPNCLEVQQD